MSSEVCPCTDANKYLIHANTYLIHAKTGPPPPFPFVFLFETVSLNNSDCPESLYVDRDSLNCSPLPPAPRSAGIKGLCCPPGPYSPGRACGGEAGGAWWGEENLKIISKLKKGATCDIASYLPFEITEEMVIK